MDKHLKQLESEAIYIFREVAATCENPVMLYSIGKDSSVMLHIARKAFYPESIPFPLLHIDTTYKFKEMIKFRDYIAKKYKLNMLVYTNKEALKQGMNPFTYGSVYTDVMKTKALKDALKKYGFNVAFGGGRRDEEKSRAKERIFSFRNKEGMWNPKNQRPELWNLYNTHINKGESIRVFPLSNWTESDIWEYIKEEKIEIVPLYFSKRRPCIEYNDSIIMIDDNRIIKYLNIKKSQIKYKNIRFRTLGCYPLTGAIESNAKTIDEIVKETKQAINSERITRVIDKDGGSASMEKRKREGHF